MRSFRIVVIPLLDRIVQTLFASTVQRKLACVELAPDKGVQPNSPLLMGVRPGLRGDQRHSSRLSAVVDRRSRHRRSSSFRLFDRLILSQCFHLDRNKVESTRLWVHPTSSIDAEQTSHPKPMVDEGSNIPPPSLLLQYQCVPIPYHRLSIAVDPTDFPQTMQTQQKMLVAARRPKLRGQAYLHCHHHKLLE